MRVAIAIKEISIHGFTFQKGTVFVNNPSDIFSYAFQQDKDGNIEERQIRLTEGELFEEINKQNGFNNE